MSPVAVRGWCPTALRPMATGDGLLVRVHPRAATLTAGQARAVAALAVRRGNGLLDLSSRGNVQIRGVRPDDHPGLVAALTEGGLIERELTHERAPAVVVSPLTGADPDELIDGARLAEAVEAVLARNVLQDLPAKFAVVLDAGGRLSLADVAADCWLRAVPGRDGPRLAVALAAPDGPEWIGDCSVSDGASVVRAIAHGLVQWRGAMGSAPRRIRDLPEAARADLADTATALRRGAVPLEEASDRESDPIGVVELSDGRAAAFVAAPFGRLDAALLDTVAGWSERFGAGEVRVSPWRSLALVCPDRAAAQACLAAARDAGLLVHRRDPRRAVAACPGAPACASAGTPAQADALALADAADRLGLTLHVSGCAKGCAHPSPADLTLVGRDGAYDVVIAGTARATPVGRTTREGASAALRSFDRSSGGSLLRGLHDALATGALP